MPEVTEQAPFTTLRWPVRPREFASVRDAIDAAEAIIRTPAAERKRSAEAEVYRLLGHARRNLGLIEAACRPADATSIGAPHSTVSPDDVLASTRELGMTRRAASLLGSGVAAEAATAFDRCPKCRGPLAVDALPGEPCRSCRYRLTPFRQPVGA